MINRIVVPFMLLALAACSGAGQPPPMATAMAPATSTSPPPFDRMGNANYDADGNYIGPHGVGQLVGPSDNPDRNPGLAQPSMPSAADFPAGACTTTATGTQCRSSSTTSSSSSAGCVTVDGTTRCSQSDN